MENTTPTLQEVKDHFAKAKEICCPNFGILIDVSSVSNFNYNEETESWTAAGNEVTFWKGGEFSEITRKKCGNCSNCLPCKEKRILNNKNS